MLHSFRARVSRTLCPFLLTCALAGQAQVLARPGWTGSGITTQSWWQSGVFYRIAPEHFQDSDGDGVGDLRGIVQRLDYLQALGVDAIVLQLPFDDTGFDDLLEQTSHRHIRLVIGLDRSHENQPAQALQAVTGHWLARGAAGVMLPPAETENGAGEPLLLAGLRAAASRFPGERLVIATASTASAQDPALGGLVQHSAVARATKASAGGSPQLVVVSLPIRAEGGVTPTALINALTPSTPRGSVLLMQLEAPANDAAAASGPNSSEVAAAALLLQHSAVLLEYGQELGQPAAERMPWTPTNVTTAPPPPEPAKPAAPVGPFGDEGYGPFRPYTPPPRSKPQPPPPPPGTVVLPDPDTLPGFSSKAAPADSTTSKVPSAVMQERDPSSLLNLYRHLLALHHGNATVREGGLVLLYQSGDAVVWLRSAPAGARTVQPVLVAVNCGDTPAVLSLDSELRRRHLRTGILWPLLRGGGEAPSSNHLALAPHAIFLSELGASH